MTCRAKENRHLPPPLLRRVRGPIRRLSSRGAPGTAARQANLITARTAAAAVYGLPATSAPPRGVPRGTARRLAGPAEASAANVSLLRLSWPPPPLPSIPGRGGCLPGENPIPDGRGARVKSVARLGGPEETVTRASALQAPSAAPRTGVARRRSGDALLATHSIPGRSFSHGGGKTPVCATVPRTLKIPTLL